MILWVTGNIDAGKTTLAHQFPSAVVIDSDDIRGIFHSPFTEEGRREHNKKLATLAKV